MLWRDSISRRCARSFLIASIASCSTLGRLEPLWAQDPAQPGAQLQTLVQAEQVALEANDPAQILPAARQLGAVALQLLGTLYLEEHKCVLANDAYRHSLAALGNTGDSRETLQISMSLLTSELCADRFQEAGEVEGRILALAGSTAQVHLLLADAHHSAGDLAGMIAALYKAVALEPNSGMAHLALGNAYWELNEYQYNQDSLREFTQAQKLLPNDFKANENLGSVLSEYERYDEAAGFLHKAADEDSRSPSPWLVLGMNAYGQGRMADARTALKRAVALTGSNESLNGYQIRRAYAVLSRLATETGDAAEAEEYAQREQKLHAAMRESDSSRPLTESTGAIRIEDGGPASGSARRSSADAAAGTDEQLVRQLNEIVAKSLNDAGTVLARNHDYASALPLFQIASTADPNLQPVMRNLGLAAFHTGDFKTAADALSHALEQRPDDALVQNDLAQSRVMLSGHASPH